MDDYTPRYTDFQKMSKIWKSEKIEKCEKLKKLHRNLIEIEKKWINFKWKFPDASVKGFFLPVLAAEMGRPPPPSTNGRATAGGSQGRFSSVKMTFEYINHSNVVTLVGYRRSELLYDAYFAEIYRFSKQIENLKIWENRKMQHFEKIT